jgi:hypothetical protein
MIKLEKQEVVGWEHAIRGMRNPMNSWKKIDSQIIVDYSSWDDFDSRYSETFLGENDHKLMMDLTNGGPAHAKYRRMITVYVDITAPLYWWKEFDTYKVGTVANSCSTMHKIHTKEFTFEDFSIEHLHTTLGETYEAMDCLADIIILLNKYRDCYLVSHDKHYWWQMIQLLPSSYNQKRTVMLNYEVLANMYHSRKNHKLDEWVEFCKWIKDLPYSELITGEN